MIIFWRKVKLGLLSASDRDANFHLNRNNEKRNECVVCATTGSCTLSTVNCRLSVKLTGTTQTKLDESAPQWQVGALTHRQDPI